MLKKIRAVLGIIVLALITFHFIDFAGLAPGYLNWLERIQFVPSLASHTVIITLVLFLLTFLLGRIYCSVICPLGIFQDVSAWLSKKLPRRKKRYRYLKPRPVLRWVIFGIFILAFAAGFLILASLLDPYAIYGRISSHLLYPLYVLGNNLLENIFTSFGSYAFYKMDPSILDAFSFATSLLYFGIIAFLAWRWGRLYCNTICPVGTLLGLIGKYSIFRIKIDSQKCISCGACGARCKATCIDVKGKCVDNSRCVACYNCLGTCKYDALHYTSKKLTEAKCSPRSVETKEADTSANPENRAPEVAGISRRTFIATSLAAVFALPKVLAQHPITVIADGVSYKRDFPIAPPGAGSIAHLNRHCTACHLCISKCPSRVLKPSLTEYGLSGLMQPVMFYEKGYCNFDCTVCGDVCPNKAIRPLTVEQKHRTQVGKVVFLIDNCVVYRDNTSCGACSEHCPTQAVRMVPYKDGLTIPETDPDICVGCGGCEFICPVRPFRAIYVNGNPEHLQRAEFHDEKVDIEIDDFGF